MEEKGHGSEEAQDAQREDRAQEPQTQPVDAGVNASAYEAQIAERDNRIKELEAELEAQVAEAAKTAEATEALKSQIEELKAQGESDHVEFELRLADVCNVKAARAILDEHGGDVAVLKEAEPWLFADTVHKQSDKTGLPNAGTSTDEGRHETPGHRPIVGGDFSFLGDSLDLRVCTERGPRWMKLNYTFTLTCIM